MLGALFEQAPVGQAVWDAELRYAAINDALARINGHLRHKAANLRSVALDAGIA